MNENKDKTDCFAYSQVPIRGGSKAKCEILNKLYCRCGECNWYETKEAHEQRMERADKKN